MKKNNILFKCFLGITVLFLVTMKQAIAQSRVVLPGNFQSELGCAGDWMPDGSCTDLTFNASSGNWEGSFTIPAGCYEYKVAINGSWNENYGLNGIYFGLNIPLNLAATGVVTFSYNPVTHIVTSSPLSGACPPSQIVLTGSFQSELGCAGDWYPNCSNTALTFNNTTGKWEGSFTIPAGCWEYRVNYNGGWNEYYGKNGVRSGENIRLYVATTSVVAFSFDPVTHIVTCLNNVEACMPSTVVIPGNFQSELGCAPVTYINGDWEPGCDFTRLTYNATTKLWEGTFNIPAGDWEFKVAYDNSWAENYGLNGVRGGANIPLQLCAPASITFKYNYITHLVELVAESATICINKFYDANVNGIQDYNEPPLPNVTFTLSGDAARTGTTDASGKITFTGLIPGNYNVTENIPSGYYATTATTKNISLELQMKMDFGNVCLGPGGLKGMGFWMSKNGRDVMMDYGSLEPELQSLRSFYLRNADGSDFNPATYEQLVDWLKNANAVNMAYMLSAQLAVLYLNYEAGYIKWDSYLYTPGCGSLGEGNFNHWYNVYVQAFYNLWSYAYTPSGHAQRSYQECLKNAIDNANNNLSFVQPQPCSLQPVVANRQNPETEQAVITVPSIKVWPNPSGSYFNLQPSLSNEPIQLRVFDVNGRLVYSTNGASYKIYRFGENFKAGVYLAEVLQGSNRTVQKLVKQ